MKLALIRRRFSATGGAELYLQRLLDALAKRGHETHLMTEAWELTPPGVTVHKLRVNASRAERCLVFASAVQSELARQKFDCVFSLERTRQQDVYRAGDGVHRVWLQRRRQFAPWWRKPFTAFGAFHRNMLRLEAETFNPRNTRHVIVNSNMVKREILEHFSFPPERIHLVRNGVDVARFQSDKRAETRARFGVKDDEFLLLFVGSGWERKGLKYVLKAVMHFNLLQETSIWQVRFVRRYAEILGRLNELPGRKVKLLVVGKGRATQNEDVIFAGPVSDVEDAYAAADLFVFLPIYEPASNAVVEALAAGLPVVTSIYNGASELIEIGVNGTVITDPSESTRVIEAVSYWWRKRFSVATTDSTKLSLDRNVSETLAILEMAAKEKAR